MRRIGLLCLLLFVIITGSLAQVNVGKSGTISGLVYSDYYWMASNHNESLEGSNGFWFRRIYFTYDHSFSNSFSSRFRLEMNGQGDFFSGDVMTSFVKDAFLKWENEQHEILAGISPIPTLGLVEEVWGYRSVEKSPLDLHDFTSSRDFGIAAKGSLDEDERWNYHAMIGNGHGQEGAEINPGKKVMLALSYQLTEQWVVELYGDRNDLSGDRYWATVQGFAGYRTEDFSIGALYARQHRSNPGPIGDGDSNLDLVSMFAHISLSPKAVGIFRIDHMFEPNPEGEEISYIPFSNNAESTLLIGGVDVSLDTDIHLIPNIEAVIYGETSPGTTPKTDLIPRLTLFYEF